MIIPNFKCHQDEQFVYIEIKATNSKLERTEFDLSENVIVFTSPPYHLRLNLPGNVIATEEDNCEWNSDTNEFVLKLKKMNENEYFEGLDLISKLLTTPTESELNKKRNLIEIIDQDNNLEQTDECLIDDLFDENLEFNEFEQATRSILDTKFKYGFLNRYSDVIEKYQDELWQLADLKNPGQLSIEQRSKERIERENNDFDEEYYLFDQYENNKFIDDIRLKKSIWLDPEIDEKFEKKLSLDKDKKLINELDQKSNKSMEFLDTSYQDSNFTFTEDEIFRLKNLPRKEFKLTKEEKLIMLYGLVDILFAFCYDKRINEGERSTESAWNITKISSTLSWFDTFYKLEDVLVSSFRRSLCYPLYRNYDLSKSVLDDLIKVLKNGQIYLIKCFLEMQKLFNEYGDFKYLLNDLYINDYIIAIQYLDKKYFKRLVELIDSKMNSTNKERLDLDLVLLDKAADSTILNQMEMLKC